MAPTIRLLVPTAESAATARELTARPSRVGRLAFVHNGQPHFDGIAPALVELLSARAGIEVQTFRKPRYSSPLASEIADEIAEHFEAAVVGLAC